MTKTELSELLLRNPNAPTNDEFARKFASKLFPAHGEPADANPTFAFAEGDISLAASDDEQSDSCGESSHGLLQAVLASDLLSDAAIADINAMATDAAPALEREKTIGHFRFHWTEVSGNANDNTNEANVDATAAELNNCWNRYVADFREPKADLIGGVRLIEVDVFDNPSLHGSTSSFSNRIFLNSRTVVNDNCRRRTTSAHELFHRVEYSYGYVTGTAGQTWWVGWVEALGSWPQEYYAPDVDDYINRVNSGLMNPGRTLLTRSYDACHYWKYLGEQLSKRSAAVATEEQAILEVLEEYATNGLDAKAASGTITQNRISRPFDRFFQDWTKANYLKDLISPGIRYDYDEDENVTNSCGRVYGPYRHVAPTSDETISSNTFTWNSPPQSVQSYGTNYHQFNIDPSVTAFEVKFDAANGGPYSVHLALINDDHWHSIYNGPSVIDWSQAVTLAPGQYARCVLVVNGLATGGGYNLAINSCVTGLWRDGFFFVWSLVQTGNTIAGTLQTGSCGEYSVTGTVNGDQVVLQATGSCCNFQYSGTVADCSSISGNWTSECGANGVFTMTKSDAAEAMEMLLSEAEEVADDPTTARS